MRVMGQSMRSRRGRAVTIGAAVGLLASGWGAAGPVGGPAGGGGAGVTPADSTGVYFDAGANVGAGPNPFNATFTGFENVGVGMEPMKSLTTGAYNIGIGTRPLPKVTSGRYNIGIGTFSLDEL